jgi:hypothetical protein
MYLRQVVSKKLALQHERHGNCPVTFSTRADGPGSVAKSPPPWEARRS